MPNDNASDVAKAKAFVHDDIKAHGDGSQDHDKGQPDHEVHDTEADLGPPDWHAKGHDVAPGFRRIDSPEGETFVRVGPDGKDIDD